MACNCASSVTLPTVADDISVTSGVTTSCVVCEDGCPSTSSEGSLVSSQWLDACCKNEGVTILGRFGDKLSRFTGSGFIKLVKGQASVVSSLPLSLTTLWHNFWKTGPGQRPILGEPLPFDYLVIAEKDSIHGIRGNDTEDSTPVWDSTTKKFSLLPLSENPLCQKGLLPRASTLELVGYSAIAANGDVDAVRCLSTITGSGLIVVNQVATVDSTCACVGCEPEDSFASVASFLPNPTTGTTHTLKFNVTTGLHYWSADA